MMSKSDSQLAKKTIKLKLKSKIVAKKAKICRLKTDSKQIKILRNVYRISDKKSRASSHPNRVKI